MRLRRENPLFRAENDLILLESKSADTQQGFAAMFGKGGGAFGRKPPARAVGK